MGVNYIRTNHTSTHFIFLNSWMQNDVKEKTRLKWKADNVAPEIHFLLKSCGDALKNVTTRRTLRPHMQNRAIITYFRGFLLHWNCSNTKRNQNVIESSSENCDMGMTLFLLVVTHPTYFKQNDGCILEEEEKENELILMCHPPHNSYQGNFVWINTVKSLRAKLQRGKWLQP